MRDAKDKNPMYINKHVRPTFQSNLKQKISKSLLIKLFPFELLT